MIDVIVNLEGIDSALLETVERAAEAALLHENAEGDIDIVLTDDGEIRALNLGFRGIDAATDVLSFPAREGEALADVPDGFLGDIAISCPRAFSQAAEYGHSPARELAFLAVHGTLHILGYDHLNEADAKKMYALQDIILNDMGLKR
ncbi:MAG: rRNA maturation RNase YbeY [Clostridiaceae bacterium]|nr:rRNA maturation RNase YbeY [Eubacteriales bacterium]